jgi:predicted lipoprotein with Yx(FWY)xxD motif
MDDAGTCAGIRPQLGVYLTGAIAPADRVVVVRHLAACDGCRAELAGLAGLPALLRRPPVQAAAQDSPADDTMPDYMVRDYTFADNTFSDYPVGDEAGGDHPGAARMPGRMAEWPGQPGRMAGQPGQPGRMPGQPGRMARWVARRRRWLLVAAAFVLVVAAGAGWALHLIGPSGSGPRADATLLHTRTIGDVTVLTDDEGYTLYWFGPDSATKSACQGSCARSWQPVTGPATWGPGVTGSIGAIVRPGGALQATYNGHPLYTTTADTGPGQTKGNGVWSHGGEWHEVTVPSRAD